MLQLQNNQATVMPKIPSHVLCHVWKYLTKEELVRVVSRLDSKTRQLVHNSKIVDLNWNIRITRKSILGNYKPLKNVANLKIWLYYGSGANIEFEEIEEFVESIIN